MRTQHMKTSTFTPSGTMTKNRFSISPAILFVGVCLLAIVTAPIRSSTYATATPMAAPSTAPSIPVVSPTPAQGSRYVLTLQVKQYHYSLNIMTHIKDANNVLTFQIPVDKAFYDSVSVGQPLQDNFRTASLLLKGSFGGWDVKVTDKTTE